MEASFDRDISIWIDEYDDIFSDFDPRPYSERNISDDFLYELKKVVRENNSHINELKLQVPQKVRETAHETVIIKNLHSYFRKNQHFYDRQLRSEKQKGFSMIVIAILMMLCASYLVSLKSESFLMHTLLIIFEPAGWFLMWTGLDKIIITHKKDTPEFDFFSVMSKCKISFVSI